MDPAGREFVSTAMVGVDIIAPEPGSPLPKIELIASVPPIEWPTMATECGS